jgi:hypothetical protein
MLAETSSPAVAGGVRWILRAEGLALLAAATAAYAHFGFGFGYFALGFLAPDLTFVGYLAGPRVGAAAYNAAHSTILPLALCAAGALGGPGWLLAVGLVGLAHIGFDRALGYGLKYAAGFHQTSLSSRPELVRA